ncbi:hypothetical protein [Xylanimonas sp. McL0601]|uniref:hypothetical protein n=1 Tax=Xylanimonas sp. McL0601 TaxID=3414739 RepID=UPI003CF013BD
MATLPWLAHLSRRELEMLVTEIAHDLADRPASAQKDRAEADLGCWQVMAETYGSVEKLAAAAEDDDAAEGS